MKRRGFELLSISMGVNLQVFTDSSRIGSVSSGSGSILTITAEGLSNKGGIPLRVRERGQTPPMRR
jgi:hypothetical protein